MIKKCCGKISCRSVIPEGGTDGLVQIVFFAVVELDGVIEVNQFAEVLLRLGIILFSAPLAESAVQKKSKKVK